MKIHSLLSFPFLLTLFTFISISLSSLSSVDSSSSPPSSSPSPSSSSSSSSPVPTPPSPPLPIHHLTQSNFSSFVKSHPYIFLHLCQSTLPQCEISSKELQQAAITLSNTSHSNVSLATLDCLDSDQTLCHSMDVFLYPSFLSFRNFHSSDYYGNISSEGIVDHVRRMPMANFTASSSNVKIVNSKNFHQITENSGITLLLFYAPWCVNCKKLFPLLDSAADLLKGIDSNPQYANISVVDRNKIKNDITIGRIDGLGAMQISADNNITTYPQWILYRKGGMKMQQRYEYYGSTQNATEMSEYLMDLALNESSTLITSQYQFDSFVKDEMGIILFLEDVENPIYSENLNYTEWARTFKVFMDTAHSLRHKYRFAHVLSNSIARYANVTTFPTIVIFQASYYRGGSMDYLPMRYLDDISTTMTSAAVLGKWIDTYQYALVPFITPKYLPNYPKPLFVVFFDADFKSPQYRKETHYWRNKLILVQKKFPQIFFAIGNSFHFQSELKKFDILVEDDIAAGIYGLDGYKYSMKPKKKYSPNIEGITKFLYDFIALRISPFRLSQKVLPQHENNQGSIIVVADDFGTEILNNTSKDHLIYFYSGYCTYCLTHVDPVIEALATHELHPSKEPHIRVVKINGDMNDLRSYGEHWVSWEYYPQIVYVQANDKENIWKYKGRYDREALLGWVKTAASVPVNYKTETERKEEKREKMKKQMEKEREKEKEMEKEREKLLETIEKIPDEKEEL